MNRESLRKKGLSHTNCIVCYVMVERASNACNKAEQWKQAGKTSKYKICYSKFKSDVFVLLFVTAWENEIK